MKPKLLFLLLLCNLLANAQTIYVEGAQAGVWDADTVRVVGDVHVKDSLCILPGTVVLFEKFYGIMVAKDASFFAQGTKDDSIVFTVADTTGFYIYNSGLGGWNGLQLKHAGKVRLDYCLLEYGKAADTLDRFGGALNINRCEDVEITNSTLRCNFSREFGGAVFARDSKLIFADCRINENKVYTSDGTYAMYGGGACFQKCNLEMTGMEFDANYGPFCIGGALSLDSCEVMLDRSVFTNNIGLNGGGLYIMRCNDKRCRLSNLLFDDNYSGHFAGGLAFADASPEVYNVLVTNNNSEGVSCNGVFFYQYSSPKLTNCIIYGNYPAPESLHLDSIQMWLWTFEGYAPEFRNCLIEGDRRYITGFDYIKVYENNVFKDPLFVDAEHHDFRLSEDSPCRDSGCGETPSYITHGLDLAGMPRELNSRIDIGPYEYSGAFVPQRSTVPAFAQLTGNPLGGHSQLELDLDRASRVSVTFYSMTGQFIVHKVFDSCVTGRNLLSIGDLVKGLASGVYLIEVANEQQVCTLKAVK